MKNSTFILLLFIIIFSACNSNKETKDNQTDVSAQLLTYLEESGNYINSENVPALLNADVVYENIDNNFLVIDIRDEEFYDMGHIKGAFNIKPDSILSFFENIIEPNSFDSIVLACDIGSRSAYVCCLLRLLGYNNVFSLQFGMASWHKSIAENNWLPALSSEMEGKLDTGSSPLLPKINLPQLLSDEKNMYSVLRHRVDLLLKEDIKNNFVGFNDIKNDLDKYFVINYWTEDLYKLGHLMGANQFTPKKSFHSTEKLLNIPSDKKVLVYCFTGQHGAFSTAFLRVLGYNAYSLKYGANSFIYETMKNTQTSSRVFSEDLIRNYPLEQKEVIDTTSVINMPVSIPVKGGC
ncbi:MAG: rhodanese-like domain-containing protein [Bacteroidales bacterium]|nr:rhodanese-like domain-containing protein [Bacteroidales bacterium]